MKRLTRLSAGVLTALLAAPVSARQPAFEDVVRNLRNPDPKARMSAVRMLHEAQHVEAALPVAALVNDPIDEIQLEAIAAELSFALVDDIPARRRVGLLIEVRSKGQAPQAFELGPLAVWPRASPPAVIEALLVAVDDGNPRVRTEAIYAVGVIGRTPLPDSAADQLIKALDHYDPTIRAVAARVIGRLEVKRAGDTLVKSMNDSNSAVRFAAMRALGAIHEERAIQALTEQFKYYGKGEGAWSALDALAHIAHGSSVPLFKAHLTDRDEYLRRAAVEGLGRSGDQSQLLEIQAGAGSDQSASVRAAMTFALLKLGRNVQPQLIEFLASDRTSRQVQDYLIELGPASAVALGASLRDPSPAVRARVAEVLGVIGSPDSLALLEPLTKDRNRSVADAASVAIERLKMRR